MLPLQEPHKDVVREPARANVPLNVTVLKNHAEILLKDSGIEGEQRGDFIRLPLVVVKELLLKTDEETRKAVQKHLIETVGIAEKDVMDG